MGIKSADRQLQYSLSFPLLFPLLHNLESYTPSAAPPGVHDCRHTKLTPERHNKFLDIKGWSRGRGV
jgi:hypothetical protein